MIIRERLTAALAGAVRAAAQSGRLGVDELPAINLDVPPGPEMGDFSTDLALTLARQARQPAAAVAELLAGSMELPSDLVQRVDVSGAGILNFHLKADWLQEVVREARRLGPEFGRPPRQEPGPRAQVEFVSADPTAPLTVTHGRGAALGDSLARILEWNGYRVTREFYVNDAGSQMERFGRSLEARCLQLAGRPDVKVPVDGYQGEYLTDLAREVLAGAGAEALAGEPEARRQALVSLGRDAMLASQRDTLARFGVVFDQWYSESALHESGRIQEMIRFLVERGHAYETEGAVWLRTTAFGDSEDRPLLRSNGRPTYLAGDLAYHQDKFSRGYDRVIDIWGVEHLGYVQRTRAGIEALGGSPSALEIIVFQPVALRIDGILVEGSGAAGNNIQLREVINAVGKDVARFFYLSRSPMSPLELDLDLARTRSAENPAHGARRALERLDAAAAGQAAPPPDAGLEAPDPAGRALMRSLADFPDTMRAAAADYDPSRLVRYLLDAAAAVEACFPESPPADRALPPGRAALAEAGRVVLRSAFAALGIDAPPDGGKRP